MTRWLLAVIVGLGTVLGGRPAAAHEGATTAFAAVTVQGRVVRYALTLSAMPSGPSAPASGPVAETLAPAIARNVMIHADGRLCRPARQSTSAPTPLAVSVSAAVDFVCPTSIGTLTVHDDLFDVLGTDLHTIARIDWSGGSRQFTLGPDAREATVVIGATDPKQSEAAFVSAVMRGLQAMLTGYDHLAFILMLIAFGGTLARLLAVVSALAMAQGAAIVAAASHAIAVPEQFIATAVALTIGYVAAENLWLRRTPSHRWAAALAFGAIHGVGLAHVLGLPGGNAVNQPESFGIALGSVAGLALAVVAILPLLIGLRRSRWRTPVAGTLSAAALCYAVFLVIQPNLS
jgi:hypothetical protein